MKLTKKLIAIILVLCMMTGVISVIAACDNTKDLEEARTTALADLDSYAEYWLGLYTFTEAQIASINKCVTDGKEAINAAEDVKAVNAALANAEAEIQKITGGARYTLNEYSSSISHQWNPHTYESAEEADLFAYITIGLYEFVLNETKDGYKIVPELAAELAEDVTSEYVGKYGVNADDKGKVWKVKLNPNAKWETGEAITADDYIFSMEALLNSNYKNYRSTAFTSSDGELYNAAYYSKQDRAGGIDWQPVRSADDEDLIKDAASKELYIVWDEFHGWLEDTMIGFLEWAADEYGGEPYFMDELAEAILAFRTDDEEATRIDNNEEFQEAVEDLICMFGAEDWMTAAFYNNGSIPVVTWEEVGFKKTANDEIIFALVNPVDEFYLYYSALSYPFLVHEETYKACLSETEGLYTSSYCTSMETTVSYGPYKMSGYQQDKYIAWDRNPYWYGWTDEAHKGLYQTTDIRIDVIPSQATAFNMFLQGKFDSVSVTSSQMSTYRSGPNTLYTPSTNTWKLTYNSSKTALAKREKTGINKTLLSYNDFRKAISLSIDKAEFVAQNFPASQPGFGLINNMYVYDYNEGTTYRSTEIAKQILVDYYGVEYGPDKVFKTLDEAYKAMTGYSRDQSLTLFRQAFKDAKEAGDYKDGDVVTLEFLMYSSDQTYIDVFNFVYSSIQNVIKGTELEGKIVLERNGNGGEEFYDVMTAGETDIILSAWGGGQFDPFGTIQCYLDPDAYTLHEYGADIGKELTLTLHEEDNGGTSYTMSLTQWAQALNGTIQYQGSSLTFKTEDFDTKLYILANLEKEFLDLNAVCVLWYVTGASMHSYKINYGTNTYVNLVGYGGIREMTYNFNNADWAAWVASQLKNSDRIDYTQKPAA